MAMSEEQRKRLSEQAKERWAAKRAEDAHNQNKNPQTEKQPENGAEAAGDLNPEPTQPDFKDVPTAPTQDYGDLLARIQELEEARSADQKSWMELMRQMMQTPAQNGSTLQIGNQGLVGSREKYILDKSHYPDPRARLADEPRLQRFAFKDNYELEYEVSVSQYQTKDGINTREPKFTLSLNRVMFDDDTGLPTNQRYTACRGIFHEDPEAALMMANEHGIDTSIYDEKHFLDEMRYMRMRDWLFDAFFPPKPQTKRNKKEMVIANRVVEVFEINSEEAQNMPFDMLNKNRKF